MIDSFHPSGNSSLFQTEKISLWIWKRIVLHPALINSAGIWSIPGDLWLFSISIAKSTSKALGLGTRGSAVCISVCLTSLTPCTFSSCEKNVLHLTKILWESATYRAGKNKNPYWKAVSVSSQVTNYACLPYLYYLCYKFLILHSRTMFMFKKRRNDDTVLNISKTNLLVGRH